MPLPTTTKTPVLLVATTTAEGCVVIVGAGYGETTALPLINPVKALTVLLATMVLVMETVLTVELKVMELPVPLEITPLKTLFV